MLITEGFVVRLLLRISAMAIVTPKTVFILGAPRSGTSLLLYMLVRDQPCIGGSNLESKFYTIANKQPFRVETFLNDDYFNSILKSDDIRRLFRESASAIEFFKKAVDLNVAEKKYGCFVEKSPVHTLFYDQLLSDFENVSFILIYRNPAANIYSIATTKWINLPCDKLPDVVSKNKMIRYFFAMTLYYKYWHACKKVERLKETVLTLNYEDIVLGKSDIKEQLEEALGQELEPLYIARPFSAGVAHKNSGFDTSRVNDFEDKMPRGIKKIAQLVFNPKSTFDFIARTIFLFCWLEPTRILSARRSGSGAAT